jgi:hypothetical protein
MYDCLKNVLHNRSGSEDVSTQTASFKCLREMCSAVLGYLQLRGSEMAGVDGKDIFETMTLVRMLLQVLSVALLSYISSHTGNMSQTLFADDHRPSSFTRYGGKSLSISAKPHGLISFYRCELACLAQFIAGPLWMFSRLEQTFSEEKGYAVSVLLADFDDLWGPTRLVYSSKDMLDATVIHTFGGNLVAVEASVDTGTSGGEISCHWQPWSATAIPCQNFDPSKTLLIGRVVKAKQTLSWHTTITRQGW